MIKEVFLSVIIPAFKEADRIGVTLLSLENYFKNKKYLYEIIVVNDGSPDNLAAVVRSFIPRVKNLRIIDNKTNHGKGYAVKCGMREARGRYQLFMDADNSVSISNLGRFIAEIDDGSEVVIGSIEIGSEKKNEQNGFHRRLFSWLSKIPVRMFATPGIRDTQRGFKLFSRKAAKIIFSRQTIDRFAFDIELLVIAIENKLQIKELPVAFDNPTGSTVGLFSYVESFADLMKISAKNAAGVYSISEPYSLLNSVSARQVGGVALSVLLLSGLFSVGFIVQTGIGMQARAAVPVPVEIVSISESSSELYEHTAVPAPAWLYSRKPMTKTDTGTLLAVSVFLILLGADFVSGMVLPRLYSSMQNSFLKSKAASPVFASKFPGRRMRNAMAHSVT